MNNRNGNIETGMTCKCGFVSIIGRTNAGKSTLINRLVGEKISIVSAKVQSTRREVRGIIQYGSSQVIFVDTPGFCWGKTTLEKALMSNFKRAYDGSDVVLMLIDCTTKNWQSDFQFIPFIPWRQSSASGKISNKHINSNSIIDIEKISVDKPFAVVLNKVDRLSNKTKLLEIATNLKKYKFIDEVFMISALTGEGIAPVEEYLSNVVPAGPWLYFDAGPKSSDRALLKFSTKTDLDLKTRLAELTRETIFDRLEKELPYSIYIQTDKITVTDKQIKLIQSIIVMRKTQKAIVLGHKGEMISAIRKATIAKMRKIFGKNIELKLFVLVKENWVNTKEHLINAGIF